MPNAERKHRCGGTLVAAPITIVDDDGTLLLSYPVTGFICDRCHEQLIEKETVREIQHSQTPIITWGAPATTRLSAEALDLMPASISTAA